MLQVWGRKTSSNVQAVMWSVGELKLAYERYDVGHRYGGLDTPEYLAINPNGTIPVVRDDDGEPLWESAAILAISPIDTAARPTGRKTSPGGRISINGRNGQRSTSRSISPGRFSGKWSARLLRRRNPDALRQAIRVLDHYLDIAEKQLASAPYLCGDDFTLADVQFGHLLYRYFDYRDRATRARRPSFLYERLVTRPAYREHVMVPYDELRAVD